MTEKERRRQEQICFHEFMAGTCRDCARDGLLSHDPAYRRQQNRLAKEHETKAAEHCKRGPY